MKEEVGAQARYSWDALVPVDPVPEGQLTLARSRGLARTNCNPTVIAIQLACVARGTPGEALCLLSEIMDSS